MNSEHLGLLPPELFIHIIALSVSHVDPTDALRWLEELRLVSKTWLLIIDSTPQFWTTIPNVTTTTRISEWIRKSGDSPLHIASNGLAHSLTSFMSLLHPLTHRWKAVTICKDLHWYPSDFLHRPAPLLENLTLLGAIFGPNAKLCAGVTPSLKRVDLTRVDLPRNPSFLNSLNELRLHLVGCNSRMFSPSQICDIVSASPNLRRLNLELNCEDNVCRRPPFPFPNLEDLRVRCPFGPRAWAVSLLSMIEAPNLINMAIECGQGSPPELFGSWLASHSPHPTTPYNVSIERSYMPGVFSDEKLGIEWSPHARLFLPDFSEGDGIPILKEIDRLGAETAPLALTIEHQLCVPACVGYLNTPTVDQDGIQRFPLPSLRSFRVQVESLTSSWDWISNFAQVRKDVTRITIDAVQDSDPSGNVQKWNESNEGRIIKWRCLSAGCAVYLGFFGAMRHNCEYRIHGMKFKYWFLSGREPRNSIGLHHQDTIGA